MTCRALLLAAVLLALPASASARPGDIGPVTTLGPGHAAAVAVQPDGRAVVTGDDGRAFLVARVRPNGKLDRSFGRGGSTKIRFRGASAVESRAVAVFRDGRILVAGTVTIRGVRRFAVARLLPRGHLDPNFGSGGKALAGPDGAQLEAMTLQRQGEVVLAGSRRGTTRRWVLVTRLLPDGTPDPAFAHDGSADHILQTGRARDV